MNIQNSGLIILLAMALMCAVPVVFLIAMPVIGTTAGVVLALGALVVMGLLHARGMRAGHRH